MRNSASRCQSITDYTNGCIASRKGEMKYGVRREYGSVFLAEIIRSGISRIGMCAIASCEILLPAVLIAMRLAMLIATMKANLTLLG
jgi:hypothetical protein